MCEPFISLLTKMKLKKVTDNKPCLNILYTLIFLIYYIAEGFIVVGILAMDNIDVIKVIQEENKQNYSIETINASIDYYFTIFIVGIIMYGILIDLHIANGLAVMCGALDHKYVPINILSYGTFVCWIISGEYLKRYLAEPNIADKKICYLATVAGILIQIYNKVLETCMETFGFCKFSQQ